MRDPACLQHLVPHLDRLIEALTPQSKNRSLRPLERRFRGGLVAMWAAQRRLTLEQLTPFTGRFAEAAGPLEDDEFDIMWLAVATATADAMVDLFNELGPVAMRRGHRATVRDVGVSLRFDLEHPQAVEFLRGYGAARVTRINETTRQRLRALLVRAGAEGWSYSRTSRRIRSMFAGFGGRQPQRHIRDRGELVAVTEMAMAYERGQTIARRRLMDQGIALEMAWLDAGDERVCPICEPNAAAGWIPATEQFPSGDTEAPSHPACRCATTTRIAEQSSVLAG